ncbi:hypothetical protein 2 [Sanxia tombus-like virus 9]|uniref:hypothetical protein 2 n=1 Tax=Sanxia tombus-like virus 9 TaxID=1923393 RepID=UPI00090C5C49|nr:hypothetical protein 2 [Sanxia tombus-like virus 9]APG76436.1 hypothetical protein 2 [Sanxia tombus-like virus 9]
MLSRLHVCFHHRGRQLLPPLCSLVPMVPAAHVDNVVSSIELRVAREVPRPHPLVCAPKLRGKLRPYLLHPAPLVPTPLAMPLSPPRKVPPRKPQHLSSQLWEKVQAAVNPELVLATTANATDTSLPTAAADHRLDPSSQAVHPCRNPENCSLLLFPGVPKSDPHGPESLAMVQKAMGMVPESRTENLQQLADEYRANHLLPVLGRVHPLPWEEWLQRFPSNRSLQLNDARSNVQLRGLLKSDCKVDCFLKVETSTNATDPRNISPRSAEFLSVLGPYVAGLENKIRTLHDHDQIPYLVKGLTPSARAQIVRRKERAWVVEIDYSRYDMTISEDVIRELEIKNFKALFVSDEDPALDAVLDALISMNGYNSLGVKYTVDGTRASGDAHTSIGNGLLGRFLLWVCLRGLPDTVWDSVHEGDDGLLFVDDGWQHLVMHCLQVLPCFGFQAKLRLCRLDDALFCGRLNVNTSNGAIEIADIPRTLGKFHTSCKTGDARTLALAKAFSYYHTDRDTPIIGPLCWALIQHLRPLVSPRAFTRRINTEKWFEREKIEAGMKVQRPPRITPEARAAVDRVFDVGYGSQLVLEKQLSSWASGVSEVPPLILTGEEVVDHTDGVKTVTVYA